MLRGLGTSALILVVIVVIVVVAAVPLFLVYRSMCDRGGDTVTSYDLVLPWDEPPAGCSDSEQGIEIVGDALGL